MTESGLWEQAVYSTGPEFREFARDYWGAGSRRLTLVVGAGFDPRAKVLLEMLAPILGDRLKLQQLKESRQGSAAGLRTAAEASEQEMRELSPSAECTSIRMLADDGAVIGGREVAKWGLGLDLAMTDDVLVDISAMSPGLAYPLVRVLWERARGEAIDLHVAVVPDSAIDAAIKARPSERAEPVHGFGGSLGPDEGEQAERLWMPQLLSGRLAELETIHAALSPGEVCPVIPFPSRRARDADELLEEYLEQISESWSVDPRNVVYASEDNPMDLYRTILRVDDRRHRVFAEAGGAVSVVSPGGTKAHILGGMLAAIERDLPVWYVEALGFEVQGELPDAPADPESFFHLWMHAAPTESQGATVE